MVKCSILGCQSKTGLGFCDATFHRFPSNDSSKEIWIKSCGRDVWKPTRHSRICSKHFETSLLVKRGNRIFLKPDALPSKNIHNKALMNVKTTTGSENNPDNEKNWQET